MNCRRALGLLGEFLDDELDAPARARLARHLDGCDDCRGALGRLRTTEGVADLPAPSLPDGFLARLAGRLADGVPGLSRYHTVPAGWDACETPAGVETEEVLRMTWRAA